MVYSQRLAALLTAILLSVTAIAQQSKTTIASYLPAKAAAYTQASGLPYAYKADQYGTTELILRYSGTAGNFSFIFNRMQISATRYIDYKDGAVAERYDFTNRKWVVEEGSHQHSDMKGKAIDTSIMREDRLYAFVLQEQPGGQSIERIQFKDFGNVVYWPDYVLDLCAIEDADKDGKPEFYLTYFGDSDGLDAKELKQIVYTMPANAQDKLVKSKATAYYPVDIGDETDPQTYHETFDHNWKALHRAIQQKSKYLMLQYKKKNGG